MWAFAHSSQLQRQTAVRLRHRWGWWTCRWASLRRFLTVCAEILWLCKPIAAAAGLRWSWRWRCWMWRSWAGVVTRGLWLWGQLNALPNFRKRPWRQLMVAKWTFNSRVTALVDISAVSMPIARSLPKLATSVALCCVIKLHILEWPFIVASLRPTCAIIKSNHFYCHITSASWYATPVRWMDYLGKGGVLTNTDLDRFVNNIWEK